jgi:uncharacterized protein (TIGR02270 family)
MAQVSNVAWGVVERHLDGAEYALERFDAGLASATLTLEDVAKGPERVFLANVNGLVIGGQAVVDRLLLPALATKKPPTDRRAAAVVVTLLRAGLVEAAIEALSSDAPSVRRGAVRGCLLGTAPGLDVWIARGLVSPEPPLARPVLLELAVERGLAVPSLPQLLRAAEPDVLIAALKAAWRSDPSQHEARLVELLQHPHPGVRDAAMVTALHHGSAYGWATCQALAFDPAAPHPLAMVLVSGLGEPGHHKRLVAMAGLDEHRAGVIRALGFAGNAAVVPLLLNHALSKDEGISAIAKEALGTIAGAEVDKLFAAKAEAEVMAGWWQRTRGRFAASRRFLAGVPANRAAFANALTSFPTRRRYLVSLLLSIRTGGASRVATRALTATQRAQIFAIAARGPDEPWARELGYF